MVTKLIFFLKFGLTAVPATIDTSTLLWEPISNYSCSKSDIDDEKQRQEPHDCLELDSPVYI